MLIMPAILLVLMVTTIGMYKKMSKKALFTYIVCFLEVVNFKRKICVYDL